MVMLPVNDQACQRQQKGRNRRKIFLKNLSLTAFSSMKRLFS
jgi:hypothetical protein